MNQSFSETMNKWGFESIRKNLVKSPWQYKSYHKCSLKSTFKNFNLFYPHYYRYVGNAYIEHITAGWWLRSILRDVR